MMMLIHIYLASLVITAAISGVFWLTLLIASGQRPLSPADATHGTIVTIAVFAISFVGLIIEHFF